MEHADTAATSPATKPKSVPKKSAQAGFNLLFKKQLASSSPVASTSAARPPLPRVSEVTSSPAASSSSSASQLRPAPVTAREVPAVNAPVRTLTPRDAPKSKVKERVVQVQPAAVAEEEEDYWGADGSDAEAEFELELVASAESDESAARSLCSSQATIKPGMSFNQPSSSFAAIASGQSQGDATVASSSPGVENEQGVASESTVGAVDTKDVEACAVTSTPSFQAPIDAAPPSQPFPSSPTRKPFTSSSAPASSAPHQFPNPESPAAPAVAPADSNIISSPTVQSPLARASQHLAMALNFLPAISLGSVLPQLLRSVSPSRSIEHTLISVGEADIVRTSLGEDVAESMAMESDAPIEDPYVGDSIIERMSSPSIVNLPAPTESLPSVSVKPPTPITTTSERVQPMSPQRASQPAVDMVTSPVHSPLAAIIPTTPSRASQRGTSSQSIYIKEPSGSPLSPVASSSLVSPVKVTATSTPLGNHKRPPATGIEASVLKRSLRSAARMTSLAQRVDMHTGDEDEDEDEDAAETENARLKAVVAAARAESCPSSDASSASDSDDDIVTQALARAAAKRAAGISTIPASITATPNTSLGSGSLSPKPTLRRSHRPPAPKTSELKSVPTYGSTTGSHSREVDRGVKAMAALLHDKKLRERRGTFTAAQARAALAGNAEVRCTC